MQYFMKKAIVSLLIFCLFAISLQAQDDPRAEQTREVKVGDWSLILKTKPGGKPGSRAPATNLRLYRKSPREKEPILLYEETSTSTVRYHLRDDGLLILKNTKSTPLLFWPDSKEPHQLEFLSPTKQVFKAGFSRDVHKIWFLGDCVLYERQVYPGHILIGFFRIDISKRKVFGEKISLEIGDVRQEEPNSARILPVAVRVGDFIFWVNEGYHNSYYEPKFSSDWKHRRVRVISLVSGGLTKLSELPSEVIAKNIGEIMVNLQTSIHNSSPELEIWAIEMIAKYGSPDELSKLKKLAANVELTTFEMDQSELRTTDKPVKETYSKSIAKMERRLSKKP